MNKGREKIIKILLLTIVGMGLIFTIANFNNNNGDPLINLVFAKSLRNGFFYYGNNGPKSGSTSPLFVLLTAPFYLIFREPTLIIIKIFYFLLYLSSAYFLILVGRKIVKDKELISYLLLAVYLGNIYFGYLTATLYDSILLFLCLIIFYYILFNVNDKIKESKNFSLKNSLLLGFFGFLSLIARPDSFIAILIGYLWLFLKVRRVSEIDLIKKFIISFVVLILLSGIFYLFLGIKTGHLIPTSVIARASLKSNGFINIIKIFTSRFWVYYIFFGYFMLCFLAFLFRREISKLSYDSSLINLLFITILVYLPIFLYSAEVRYISGAFPAIVLISFLIIYFLLTFLIKINKLRFLLVLFITFTILYSLAIYIIFIKLPVYSEDIIFEKNLCDILNNISKCYEKVAVYEIQVQYCLNSQALSLDGIVGGEILPYFKKKSDLTDFFEEYRPDYLVLSDYVLYREEFKNTILEELYNKNYKLKLGDEYSIGRVNFKKIAENESDYHKQIKGMRFWLAVYRLQYN